MYPYRQEKKIGDKSDVSAKDFAPGHEKKIINVLASPPGQEKKYPEPIPGEKRQPGS